MIEKTDHSLPAELKMEVMGFEKEDKLERQKRIFNVLGSQVENILKINFFNLVKYCRTRK